MKLIKRCLILLALVWAQIPASVLAQLCQPTVTCAMPCCVAKAIHPTAKAKPVCAMCPDEGATDSKDSSKSHETEISSKSTSESCPCKIAPRTYPAEHSFTACFTNASGHDQAFYACTDVKPLRFELAIFTTMRPGIIGSDSGPPIRGPSCVWLGRAPPTAVA